MASYDSRILMLRQVICFRKISFSCEIFKGIFKIFLENNALLFTYSWVLQLEYNIMKMFKCFSHISALVPIANQLVKRIRKYPHMHDSEYAEQRFGKASSMAPLVLPYVQGERRRIIYTISEYEPLLDSSNMTFSDWEHIAEDIRVR